MVDQAKLTWIERALLTLILGLSLFLRLSALDVFVTSDEDLWYGRSKAFSEALRKHDWERTYQSGHPGVITMWLGAAADRWGLAQPAFLTGPGLRQLMHASPPAPSTGLPPLTVGARMLVGLITWLGILAAYPLVRRLFGAPSGLLGTVLIALDPFFLTHSRFHHLDALLTTFMVLSLLSLLVFQFRRRHPGYLLASAALAGLAVANKSPGVFLVPCAGLILLSGSLFGKGLERRREFLRAVGALAIWGLIAAVVFVAIWPAMWVKPLETLRQEFSVAKNYAENPHEASNYFWFAVRPDPGPGFYPVAWAFRTTPWVLLGLLGWIIAWRKQKERGLAMVILLCALLYTVAMTAGQKKFDRYLLPIFPLLDLLAAVGWVALAERWRTASAARRIVPVLAAGLIVGQLILVWPTRPYYHTYYNPAVGGSRTAPQILVMGWGEGLDRAAAYLNTKPDADKLIASSWHKMEFAYFFRGTTIQTQHYLRKAEPDYYSLYYSVLQRHLMPEISEPLLAYGPPEFKATLNGIDYAWVCPNTIYRQAEQAIISYITAQADPKQDLIVVDLNSTFARHYTGTVPLRILAVPARDDVVQTALQEAAAGRRRVWQLSYPDGVPARSALIAEHLRQQATVGDEITVDGVRAVRYDLRPGARFLLPEPSVAQKARFGEQIRLVGYDAGELVPGRPFRIRLYWQTDGPVATSYTVFAHLIGPGERRYSQCDAEPQGGARRTNTWAPGEQIVDDHVMEVPAAAPPGEYVVAVGMYPAAIPNPARLPAYDGEGKALPNQVVLLFGFKVTGQSQP